MPYQIFARKYRPQLFDEVLGQEVVVQTLKNTIELKRVHQAYLFCGARGVGKTSLARILAKCLNCEKGATVNACQTCPSCRGITDGSSLDVLEIDGASNTGVDDVRELREQVKYLPATGQYKIYIIDEVHMLSTSAFNALLKTLEEPPPHILFIFATTEPHKIPITILSRCQRFDFRRMSVNELVSHLQKILEQERLKLETEILNLIARSADGSVRDSLSLLDQIISFCGSNPSPEQARELLGLADQSLLADMMDVLLNSDTSGALKLAQRAYEKGCDLKIFSEGVLESLHSLLLFSEGGTLDLTGSEREQFEKWKTQTDTGRLLILFQILARGIEEMARSEFPRLVFDTTLIKMIRSKEYLLIPEILEKLNGAEKAPNQENSKKNVPPTKQENSLWGEFVRKVCESKPQVGSILEHAVPIQMAEGMIKVGFEPKSLYADMLKDRIESLKQVAKEYFKKEIRFEIESVSVRDSQGVTALEMRQREETKKTEETRARAMAHPMIQKAQEILGAVVKEVKEIK